jgi:ParB/RepB/Spo0J family partition protein
MAKKRIVGTEQLFQETEEIATALAAQPEVLPRHIPIARLLPNRFNPRRHYPGAAQDELVRSMAEHGFIGALDGRELPDGKVELAYGSRRLLAARSAGLSTVPVTLHEWSDAQMCFISLAENLAHVDLDQSDQASLVRQVRDELGLVASEIAEMAGKSATWVDERLVSAEQTVESGESDAEVAALEEIVASLAAGVYKQEETLEEALGLPEPELSVDPRRGTAGRHEESASPTLIPHRDWTATGNAMLVLAFDALTGFEPDSLPEREVEEALGWLVQLGEAVTSFTTALETRRQRLEEERP